MAALYLFGAGCNNPGAEPASDAAVVDPTPDAPVSPSDDAAPPQGERKRVFLTGAFLGTLYDPTGGLVGGDRKCDQAAQQSGLEGSWRVWLSAGGVDAIDRLVDVGPWYLVDRQTLVFADRAQLTTGPSAPITMTHSGETIPSSPVWTGTAADGTGVPDDCSDWTADQAQLRGLVGTSGSTGVAWTASASETCGLYAYLYCFEQ